MLDIAAVYYTQREVLFAILSAFTEVAVTLAWALTIPGGKHSKQKLNLIIPIDIQSISEHEPGAMDNKTRQIKL